MRRRAALAGAALGVGLLVVPSASAEPPERTGWWSAASAPGLAVPQPTTAEGDLRVARGRDVLAYGAVLYPTDGSPSATLSIPVRPGRTTGTPDVVACPTADTAWEGGGNQPYDKAPAYDCVSGMAVGLLSEDGTTLDFGLDATQHVEPGVWSLALVPNPEASAPFTIDLQAPPDEAFAAEPPPDASPFAGPEVSSEPEPGFDGGTGSTEVPFAPTTGFPADPGGDGSAFAPLLADDAPVGDLTGGAGEELPLVAAEEPAGATVPTRTVAASEQPAAGVTRVLALLVLIVLCAAVGHAAGQQRPGPRLLGGRARALRGSAGAAAPVTISGAAAAAGPLLGRHDRPRGIGRFARTRDEPPRRLL